MARAAAISQRTGFILRVGLAAAIFAFGIAIANPGLLRRAIFGLALFALPLLCQFVKWPLVRAYALWFGVFLVIQSLMTPILVGDAADFITLTPNQIITENLKEGTLPGIVGPQRITTDAHGFRVFPPVDYEHKLGLRIFAIGGSTTEEISLDDQATWTHGVQVALARDLAKPVEVINTGVSGLMARHHLATLKHILPFHPDAVLFLVGANDWNFEIRRQFGTDVPPKRLTFTDTPLARLVQAAYFQVSRTNRTVQVEPAHENSLLRERKITWFPKEIADEYRATLMKISDTCRQNKLTCMFLTQPSAYKVEAPQELRDRFWMTPPAASYTLTFDSLIRVADVYNRGLIDFATERGHPICDVAPKIPPTGEYFFDEFHYTSKGSAQLAQAVADCLKPLLGGAKTTSR
jgi:lysophospholipase L1-like esterase